MTSKIQKVLFITTATTVPVNIIDDYLTKATL